MKAIVLVGLSGSGKTYRGERLAILEDAIFIDDCDIVSKSLIPMYSRIGENIIIADPHLCLPNAMDSCRKYLEDLGYDVSVEYFANDPEACIANVEYRADGRSVKELIRNYSKLYKIPEGIKAIPIWQNKR